MLRSLFSAISGLRANQTMLDVTGNNIANANTVGFKASNILFQDTLSQMLTGGSAGSATQGGTNPIQVGLGVQVGAITTSFNQGSAQVTGRATNMMISGDGFFVIKRGNEDLYTRAGAFNFDNSGNLVSPDGDLVQGYAADASGAINTSGTPTNVSIPEMAGQAASTPPAQVLQSYSIGSDGVITGVFADGSKRALFQLALGNFSNPEGLEKVGDTAFREASSSGKAQIGTAGTGRLGNLVGGSLEMSNVDLAQEFTNMITAERGFQANSRVITTSDEMLQELVNLKH
jgi:flagellar hook protein FlgE